MNGIVKCIGRVLLAIAILVFAFEFTQFDGDQKIILVAITLFGVILYSAADAKVFKD